VSSAQPPFTGVAAQRYEARPSGWVALPVSSLLLGKITPLSRFAGLFGLYLLLAGPRTFRYAIGPFATFAADLLHPLLRKDIGLGTAP